MIYSAKATVSFKWMGTGPLTFQNFIYMDEAGKCYEDAAGAKEDPNGCNPKKDPAGCNYSQPPPDAKTGVTF